MTQNAIAIWLIVVIITTGILGVSWFDSHQLTAKKIAMIERFLMKDRQISSKKNNIIVVGTSLVAHGFSGDQETTNKFKLDNINASFYRFTILSASPSELEAGLMTAIKQNVDLILVDITPWLVSFGFGEKFTHHRQWLITIIADSLGFTRDKFNQLVLHQSDALSQNYSHDSNKFKRFNLKDHALSDTSLNAIKNTKSKIFFYLPLWAKDAHNSFGEQKSLQLVRNSELFAKRYQVPLLPPPPELPNSYYTDLVHVNAKGREAYMNWLMNNIKQR